MSAQKVTFEELFRRDYGSAKIGVFGAGYYVYWDQFEGLEDKLIGHQRYFEDRLRENGGDVVSGGLVDNNQKAAQVGDMFRRQDVDFLILFMSTYSQSSHVLPVVQRAGVP
jgi:L-arabinose isomerase